MADVQSGQADAFVRRLKAGPEPLRSTDETMIRQGRYRVAVDEENRLVLEVGMDILPGTFGGFEVQD